MMALAIARREPASRLIRSRASIAIGLVRNQSRSISEGAPDISATLVSLSRNISLNQLSNLSCPIVCGLLFRAGFQPLAAASLRISLKRLSLVSIRRQGECHAKICLARSAFHQHPAVTG